MAFDVYQAVTDRILEALDRGTVPWRNPIGQGGGGLPKNLESGRPYRGINVFLLATTAWAQGYDSSDWLTYRQAQGLGGQVRKGERSSLVVFWKQLEVADRQTGEPKRVPLLRYYNVFNAAQIDGLKVPGAAPVPDEPFEPLSEAKEILKSYEGGPVLEHAGGRAYYRPATDTVRLPVPAKFLSREFYYATLFHELAHSTGHSSRLDRGLDAHLAPFGSPDYSREELIAEMGAAFLCAVAAISPPTIEQSAAYIAGWKKRLTADPKVVVMAAGAGQRAADWILGQRGPLSAGVPRENVSPDPAP